MEPSVCDRFMSGTDEIKRNPKSDTTQYLRDLKITSKQNEVFLQSILISILNQLGYEFELTKFYKVSRQRIQLFNINNVKKYDDSQLIETNFKQYIRDIESSLPQKNYNKRNYDSAAVNWMIEQCESNGIKFGYRGTRSAKFTVVMQKIRSIQFEEQTMESERINTIGERQMNLLSSFFTSTNRNSDKHIILKPYIVPFEDEQGISYICNCKGVFNCQKCGSEHCNCNCKECVKSHPNCLSCFVPTKEHYIIY